MRENGFDYPLHPLQCLTWALFPVVLLDFYWLLLPLLPGEATRWAVGTVYTAAAATQELQRRKAEFQKRKREDWAVRLIQRRWRVRPRRLTTQCWR